MRNKSMKILLIYLFLLSLIKASPSDIIAEQVVDDGALTHEMIEQVIQQSVDWLSLIHI